MSLQNLQPAFEARYKNPKREFITQSKIEKILGRGTDKCMSTGEGSLSLNGADGEGFKI